MQFRTKILIISLITFNTLIGAYLVVTSELVFSRLCKRVTEIRNSGLAEQSSAMFSQEIKISANDFLLMNCDNYLAIINHPNIKKNEITEWKWFTAAKDFPDDEVCNQHSTLRDNKWEVETFLYHLPKVKYQVSSEDVVNRYLKLKGK